MLATTVLSLKDPEELKARIKEKGMSLRRFAAEVNMSQSRVAQLTRGHMPFTSADSAVAMCAALDLYVTDLFEFPDADALTRLGLIP